MSFYVSSVIKLNFGTIAKLDNNAKKALEQTTDALLTEVKNSEVMPFDFGTLQNENTFSDDTLSKNGKTKIISNTPYARRLYFHPEYNFNREENTFAGGEWFEPWLKGGIRQNFCRDTFTQIYRRLNGI